MTEDLFSQRPRTLRGNKRIKRLSGPPAWRMMRQGKASPRETNQTIVCDSVISPLNIQMHPIQEPVFLHQLQISLTKTGDILVPFHLVV